MGRIRIELQDYMYGKIGEVVERGINYFHSNQEDPIAIWLSPENYHEFLRELSSRHVIIGSRSPYEMVTYLGIPVQMDAQTGMTCAIEVNLRGPLQWPPQWGLKLEWHSKDTCETIYDVILGEPLV